MDHEVDGRNSIPYQLDKNTIRYGQKLAARRVSRTIMLGSAPTVRAQNIRGIESSRIRLGIVQPGESIADFNDALNTLRGSLAYLYTDPSGNRYWYDTRPTLRKTATDRATQIAPSDVTYEIERRLREFRKEGPFAGRHVCPNTSNDVSDEQAVRLVILKTEDTYKQGKDRSKAITRAEEILNNRGSAPRVYRNMLAFVAPDQDGLNSLERAVRELLAWQSIKTDSETLNLDAAQNIETLNNINRSDETVKLRLKETYCWLLVPYIDREIDMRELVWDVDRISGGSESVVAKAANKMLQNEQLITRWAPALLKMELDNLLWKDDNHIQIKKLWEFITTYCYLPRLANFNVLESAIQAGINSDEFFAIASSISNERYVGLKFNEYVSSIYPTDYIVKDLVALKQINAERNKQPQSGGDTPVIPGWDNPGVPGGGTTPGQPGGFVPGGGAIPGIQPAGEPTNAICKHYYDKGIPDEPWYISPGHEGQSIQYMPNFEEEHWMRHYWFNYFSDTFYLKLSAVWDSIIDILNYYYGLDYVEDLRLRSNVMKWLKKEKNDVFSVFEEVQNSQLYKDAQKYRTAAAHGTSAGEVSRTVNVKKNVEREIPSIDKNGVITKRKVRVTEISVGAGEYTTVNTIMKNIEEYTRYSGIKIQEIIQKMQ